ncbi:hypothetical protein DPMN_170747 [Dreissena polymorpha]|uniref:Uncharacterized protein n=1 Tax=Dreissena polymorpha TaxID=45954 RepID=A0A9D4DWV0_DREPO|nr:hypothetical protein DPMN_170747 [Dreissena polymorpha]
MFSPKARPARRPFLAPLLADRPLNRDKRLAHQLEYPWQKKAPPPGGHVFQATGTIFELVQDIIGTNLQTKFRDDWKINVASRWSTMKNAPPPPPPGGHVFFQPTGIIFECVQDIIGTNLLTKVLTRKNARPLAAMFFKQTLSFFKLIQDII